MGFVVSLEPEDDLALSVRAAEMRMSKAAAAAAAIRAALATPAGAGFTETWARQREKPGQAHTRERV